MANLTKEYFDRQLNQLNKRLDSFVSKDDIKQFATKEDINAVKTDINTIKTDINAVKTDINTIKIDVNAVKTDVKTVKTDLKTLGSELRAEMKVLEQKLTQQNESLAAMIKRGLDEIYLKLDLREKVEKHEHDIRIIKEALHITR